MKYFDIDSIKLSETGSVELDDAQLQALESQYNIASAAGTNIWCGGTTSPGSSNTWCGNSNNPSSCSNYSCSGSTNGRDCI